MFIKILHKTVPPKRTLLLQCETCNIKFKRMYRKACMSANYHFCSRACCDANPGRRQRSGKSIKAKASQANEKRKQTTLDRYGVKNVFAAKQIKKRIIASNLEKYGVENPSQAQEVKEKKKQTMLKNYGVEYPGQSQEIKEKIKKVVMERYGVENVMHDNEIANRAACNGGGRALSKRYVTKFDDTIAVQGSYEQKFVQFCESNNIRVHNGPTIKYAYNGTIHHYFVDFEVETTNGNKLVEIKSTYWYDKQKDKVMAKNAAATDYCKLNNKTFCFIINKRNAKKQIDINDFKQIL